MTALQGSPTSIPLRLLGLDVGDRRVGVAISDPTGMISTPVEIYVRKDPQLDAQHVVDLISEYEAEAVVVGLPKNMNGTEGPQAQKTREFAGALTARGVDVRLWDERLSTVEAERRRTERRPRRRDMHQKIDDEVAALILQSYLDYQRLRAGR